MPIAAVPAAGAPIKAKNLPLSQATLNEKAHETVSGQLLLIIGLLTVVNWLSTFLVSNRRSRTGRLKYADISLIQPHTIALVLGLIVGGIIQFPPPEHYMPRVYSLAKKA